MADWPTIPAGQGYPLVDATTGEFVSTLVNDQLSATIAGATLQQHQVRTISLGTDLDGDREAPRLVKPLTGPFLTYDDFADAGGLPTIYRPKMFQAAPFGRTGIGVMTSSDHAAAHGDSGFMLAWGADGPLSESWTFPATQPLWRDDVNGNQTETPELVVPWDGTKSIWSYQQNGVPGTVADQVTLLAQCTNQDLWSGWSRTGTMIDLPANPEYATAATHTGYANHWRAGAWFYCYTIRTGADGNSIMGTYQLNRSRDGINWTADPRPIFGASPLTDHLTGYVEDDMWSIKFTSGAVIEWRGRFWWIGLVGPVASGTTIVGNLIGGFPLSDDFRRPLARPIDMTPPEQAWETTGIDTFGNAITYEGRTFLSYRSGGNQGSFGLMELQ
jgi:hypothetical protein